MREMRWLYEPTRLTRSTQSHTSQKSSRPVKRGEDVEVGEWPIRGKSEQGLRHFAVCGNQYALDHCSSRPHDKRERRSCSRYMSLTPSARLGRKYDLYYNHARQYHGGVGEAALGALTARCRRGLACTLFHGVSPSTAASETPEAYSRGKYQDIASLGREIWVRTKGGVPYLHNLMG